jgi:hypothetical protein
MSAAEVIESIRTLPAPEREQVYASLIADPELREDLQDWLTLETRRHEPSRPLGEVLRELRIAP